jgi:hypothetical protein
VLGLDGGAKRRGGVLRGVLRAPGRLLGAVAGGKSGGDDADADAATGDTRPASLADMWIDFLQTQAADADAAGAADGSSGAGAFGAAAAAMARGEGPNGVRLLGSPRSSFGGSAGGAHQGANGTHHQNGAPRVSSSAEGASLAEYFPVRAQAPQPLEALVGSGPVVV